MKIRGFALFRNVIFSKQAFQNFISKAVVTCERRNHLGDSTWNRLSLEQCILLSLQRRKTLLRCMCNKEEII